MDAGKTHSKSAGSAAQSNVSDETLLRDLTERTAEERIRAGLAISRRARRLRDAGRRARG
ncbi:MAG: hypothetical protein ACR2OC_06100 [Solirubrobacterales bacterium]